MYKHSSATGLTISIGGVEVDIFVAQRTIARLLRGIQKTQLLRISRAFGHWKNWDQYERIKQRTDVMVATKQLDLWIAFVKYQFLVFLRYRNIFILQNNTPSDLGGPNL